MKRKFRGIFLFAAFLLVGLNADAEFDFSNTTKLCPFAESLSKQAKYKKPTDEKNAEYILIDKKRKLLHLLEAGKVFRTFKVALGRKSGKKRQEGDEKSPEGMYRSGYKNTRSDFHMAIGVSYPNQDDIDWARKNNVSPGGAIVIHGLPNESWKHPFLGHPKKNWTAGCIAVSDREIEEMWEYVETSIPIEICSDE